MTVTETIVLRDYNKLKRLASFSYTAGLYSWAMDITRVAASLMYNFNIIYYDEDLETLLEKISKKVICKRPVKSAGKNKKIVFYDGLSWDNRGQTEQYLQGLIDNDYEILFLTFKRRNDQSMTAIIKKLEGCSNAKVYYITGRTNIRKCREIYDVIIDYGPSKVLYHAYPYDTIGFIVLTALEDHPIERFQINLTDHTFWLGVKCIDYCLEFRQYGVNISRDYRHIPDEKLIIVPYYPIQNTDFRFQGFPFNAEGKKVIVSAGSLYKIYGSHIYFDIIKRIMIKYTDTIIYYLGNGDTRPLLKFIEENKFNERFFYSTERKDINEVMKRAYFYLNTYPIGGGLLPQLAVANNKIPIIYSDKEAREQNLDELFINNEERIFTIYDLDALYHEIDRLMVDTEYYADRTKLLKGKIISVSEFAKILYSALEYHETAFEKSQYDIDTKTFSKMYFEIENKYLKKYVTIFLHTKNILVYFCFIKYIIVGIRIHKKIRFRLLSHKK